MKRRIMQNLINKIYKIQRVKRKRNQSYIKMQSI
jgi:hypothetical protein